jgi:hypothetical protein
MRSGARGAAFVAALAAVAPTAARADVVSLYGALRGGWAEGRGLSGGAKDAAFHDGAAGPTYGALIGAEVLFIDAWIEHDQYLVDGEIGGTYTRFLVGFDVDLDVGERRGMDPEGDGGVSAGYVEIGGAVGFGLGTGRQVEPPLDNGEVTDKGALVQGRIGAGWRLGPLVTLGVVVPVDLGYVFKSGGGAVANDDEDRYVEVAAAALASVRFELDL